MTSSSDQRARNPFVGPSVADRYARTRPALHGAAFDIVAARFGGVDRAIDVGCGTGLSTAALAQVAKSVVGVDTSEDMIRQVDPSTDASFVLAAAEALPFPDTTFGLATIASAIHWFEPDAVHEIRRVLGSGGGLLVYDVWFPAEMARQPDFGDWLRETSATRYPAVAKNPRPDMEAMGFRLEWDEDLRRYVAMTLDDLVEYLMTHSERIAAIERGQESEEEQDRYLRGCAARFFTNARDRRLEFGLRAEMFRATRK